MDNISKLKNIKEKKKNSCLNNYGVEYPQQSKNIFNKSLKTKEIKYNDKHFNNSEQMINTKNNNIKNKYKVIKYENQIFTFYCDKCNSEYDITHSLYFNRRRIKTEICTNCNPYNSNESPNERFIIEFIKENYDGEIIEKDRNILNGKELDIYLPKLNLAFEYNGLFCHSELYKPDNYHLNKTETCLEKGIQLIHIWEDDWKYKQNIVKSMILNKLGKTQNKIYARKCKIKEITDNKFIKFFLDNNHIQGYITSKIKLGLFYDDELVSIMLFGYSRRSTNKTKEWELLRFCNILNTNVVGSASKLLKYFIINYKDNKLITFADKSISNGGLYKKLGFKLDGITKPNFYYIIDGIKKHRFNYRKNKLIKMGFDKNKSARQIMLERRLYRIYDSGNLRFILD
ncbi:MAG: hypothetical protein M0R46_16655 [Candidatus Muirbacterium halophilum]|nr:hypothetical protein [Candidatus Muirbacterium halophilum]